MIAGEYIKIITEAVPKGIVPDKYGKLLFQRKDGKWYALFIPDGVRNIDKDHILDSNKVFLLNP